MLLLWWSRHNLFYLFNKTVLGYFHVVTQNTGIFELQGTVPKSKNSTKCEEECYFSFHENMTMNPEKWVQFEPCIVVQHEPLGTKEKERLQSSHRDSRWVPSRFPATFAGLHWESLPDLNILNRLESQTGSDSLWHCWVLRATVGTRASSCLEHIPLNLPISLFLHLHLIAKYLTRTSYCQAACVLPEVLNVTLNVDFACS